MVLNIDVPRALEEDAKLFLNIQGENLLLQGYKCNFDLSSPKCKNCKLTSFKKGDVLNIDIKNVSKIIWEGCPYENEPFFSLKFSLDELQGVKIA